MQIFARVFLSVLLCLAVIPSAFAQESPKPPRPAQAPPHVIKELDDLARAPSISGY